MIKRKAPPGSSQKVCLIVNRPPVIGWRRSCLPSPPFECAEKSGLNGGRNDGRWSMVNACSLTSGALSCEDKEATASVSRLTSWTKTCSSKNNDVSERTHEGDAAMPPIEPLERERIHR